MAEAMQLIREHFGALARVGGDSGPLVRIVVELADGGLTAHRRHDLLAEAGVLRDVSFRKDELDLLLSFVTGALSSGTLTDAHQEAFAHLKRLFRIREGEFLQHRAVELATLLGSQLELILEDDVLDPAEDAYQVALQAAFDLGYDQYLALVRRSLERADLRLRAAIAREQDPEQAADLRAKLAALAPIVRLATLRHRSLGALY